MQVPLFFNTLMSCQPQQKEEKSLASTHPALEEQLQHDSIKTPVTSNENPDLYQRYRLSMEEATAKNNYSISDIYRGKLAAPDLSSQTDAQQVKEGLKAGVNFAGKYTIVTVACGEACQHHIVIDRESGKVLEKLQSRLGASYSANSRLLVLNPPDSTINYQDCRYCSPEAYVLKEDKLTKLASIPD